MIKTKLLDAKAKATIPSTLEDAMKLLVNSQNMLMTKIAQTEDTKYKTKDSPSTFHVQKPEFVPEWVKYQKYEIFRENLFNWDEEHTSLSDSNKFGKVMMSLTKNKDIADLSKLASGKISEKLMALKDKTIPNILEILDKKYLQTKSEKNQVLSKELRSFKLDQKTLQKHHGTSSVP